MRSRIMFGVILGCLCSIELNAAALEIGETSTGPASALEPANRSQETLIPLTDEQLMRLLGARLSGGMGGTFGGFGNMFLVSSRIHFGKGVGLMSESRKIIKTELQSPFPDSYHPTLREFLDAIALQTFSEWKYDPTDKFFESDVNIAKRVDGPAIFEFTRTKREKPFKIEVADGWTPNNMGNWIMYVPPQFPVGMDIYEMGTYSTDDQADPKAFFEEIRSAVALEWATRVFPKAVKQDLTVAKVGPYEALHFDKLLKGQDKKEIHWRHWVFMVGNKCYFVVSTILPRLEDEIFPDVKKMLKSFAAVE